MIDLLANARKNPTIFAYPGTGSPSERAVKKKKNRRFSHWHRRSGEEYELKKKSHTYTHTHSNAGGFGKFSGGTHSDERKTGGKKKKPARTRLARKSRTGRPTHGTRYRRERRCRTNCRRARSLARSPLVPARSSSLWRSSPSRAPEPAGMVRRWRRGLRMRSSEGYDGKYVRREQPAPRRSHATTRAGTCVRVRRRLFRFFFPPPPSAAAHPRRGTEKR